MANGERETVRKMAESKSTPRHHARTEPLVINGVLIENRAALVSFLKGWLSRLPKDIRIADLARKTRIPESSFNNYFSGHGFPGPKNRNEFVTLIEDITKGLAVRPIAHPLQEFKPVLLRTDGECSSITSCIEELKINLAKLEEQIDTLRLDKSTPEQLHSIDPEEHANRILALMTRLDDELRYFREGTTEERGVLRNVVKGQDVGYVTSLLRAMYDEDKFQSWLLYANYQLASRKRSDGGES